MSSPHDAVASLAWKLHARRTKRTGFKKPADYYGALDRYDALKANTKSEPGTAREKRPSRHEGKFAGAIERARVDSFKDLAVPETADKETKHLLVTKTEELIGKYRDLSKSVSSSDKKGAMKALKHAHCRLDPRASMTESMSYGWLIARDKPGGDRSLRNASGDLTKARTNAHRQIYSAIAKSRKEPQRESSPMVEQSDQE